nr:MAG TPA: hypothetical protein [Caudoviricetes sp.]
MVTDIEIDESEEFLDISSIGSRIPTVTFYSYPSCRCVVSFNSLAENLIHDVDYVTVKAGKKHILFLPAIPGWSRRVLSRRNRSAHIAFAALEPYVKLGVPYRAYPYKGGIAIKRDEPIGGTQSD